MKHWNPQSSLVGLYWASRHNTPPLHSDINNKICGRVCVYIQSCYKYYIEHMCVFMCVWVLYLRVFVWQTNNCVCVMFPDHSPKISHCAAKRSLAHNKLFTVVMSLSKHEQHQTTTNYFVDVLKTAKVPINKMVITKQLPVGSPWHKRRWCSLWSLFLKQSDKLLISPLYKNTKTWISNRTSKKGEPCIVYEPLVHVCHTDKPTSHRVLPLNLPLILLQIKFWIHKQ